MLSLGLSTLCPVMAACCSANSLLNSKSRNFFICSAKPSASPSAYIGKRYSMLTILIFYKSPLKIYAIPYMTLHFFLYSYFTIQSYSRSRVAQWIRSLDLTTHTSLSPIRRGFAPCFVNYKKGALDSQAIKFTSCLPMVGGSLRLPPPIKRVAMI